MSSGSRVDGLQLPCVEIGKPIDNYCRFDVFDGCYRWFGLWIRRQEDQERQMLRSAKWDHLA